MAQMAAPLTKEMIKVNLNLLSAEKRSPLFPDNKHLHMLVYQYLFKKNKSKLKSNYSVALILNSIYLIMIIPPIFMMKSGMFCKYYSILLFVTYLVCYKKISEKIK